MRSSGRKLRLYVGAKMRPSIAAQLVGLDLPDGVSYEDLDADLTAEQQLQQQQAEAQMARMTVAQNQPRQLTGPTDPAAADQQAQQDQRSKSTSKGGA
jgi:hypothetical protein